MLWIENIHFCEYHCDAETHNINEIKAGTKHRQFETEICIVWKLCELPSIDDIVMVYDLSGDLVIQRAYSCDDPITEESKNFRFVQERNNQILAMFTAERKRRESIREEVSMSLTYEKPPSRMHIPDRSFGVLSEDNNGCELSVMELERVISDSSFQTMVSV